MDKTLLLVDDEENIVRSIIRLMRKEDYNILTANSGQEGLEILKDHQVGVILSDQRMPQMSGVEFLTQVKELYPTTVRLILSGYTDLNSITDAINQGAIFKFLTKPWEDESLRINVKEAFQHYELRRENEKLKQKLTKANAELIDINKDLKVDVKRTSRRIDVNVRSLEIAQDILESIPIGIIGISEDNTIAMVNSQVHKILPPTTCGLIGNTVDGALPKELFALYERYKESGERISSKILGDCEYIAICQAMSKFSQSKGTIFLLIPKALYL